jgi:hypothetical protein
MSIKRYADGYGFGIPFSESSNGRFVLYEDHAAEVKRLQKELAAERSVADERCTIPEIAWTSPRKPNQDVSYDHIIGKTPFGRILITWKGWKEGDQHVSIDEFPGNDFFVGCSSVDEAKEIAYKEWCRRLGVS